MTRFPEKVPELFAYQAQNYPGRTNYEQGRRVSYNRQFRREALARKDLNWSVTDTRLYSETFTGRARAIPRCSFCLQDDHTGPILSQEPRSAVARLAPRSYPFSVFPAIWSFNRIASSQKPLAELCRRYNEGQCKQTQCHHAHACAETVVARTL